MMARRMTPEETERVLAIRNAVAAVLKKRARANEVHLAVDALMFVAAEVITWATPAARGRLVEHYQDQLARKVAAIEKAKALPPAVKL